MELNVPSDAWGKQGKCLVTCKPETSCTPFAGPFPNLCRLPHIVKSFSRSNAW
uniref:Uncharacterized protein n=1 Tax=Rhizophora mucronata TaxID=61149 RepID=A0A2P2IRJ7_RHIMU